MEHREEPFSDIPFQSKEERTKVRRNFPISLLSKLSIRQKKSLQRLPRKKEGDIKVTGSVLFCNLKDALMGCKGLISYRSTRWESRDFFMCVKVAFTGEMG